MNDSIRSRFSRWYEDKFWQGEEYRRLLMPTFPLEGVDRAFERVAEIFNSDWCGDAKGHPILFELLARGSMPFVFLLELGLNLLAVQDCLRLPSIIEDLRNAEPFLSTLLELKIAAMLRADGYKIEFRPPLPSGKRSDLMADIQGQRTYVEIKRLSESDTQESFHQLFCRLNAAISELRCSESW
jgi:hypothetical protein